MTNESLRQTYLPLHVRQAMHERALAQPEAFWADQARALPWFSGWQQVLDWQEPYARWFRGGTLNASFACLDDQIAQGRRNKVALHWEAEDGQSRSLSYAQLLREVERAASGLKRLGVGRGDVVVLYLPMIPEAVVFMLACARIGAIHCVVFSGFSATALADRINDTGAKVVVTADGGFRRGRALPLKSTVDAACERSPSVRYVVVVTHTGEAPAMTKGRDVTYEALLAAADDHCDAEAMEATEPLFILYTSGTTGKPKGIVHATGGYLVYARSAFKWAFGTIDDDVYWCTADIGWITGHSAVVYGPLMLGATVFISEGTPDYPDWSRWWRSIEKYSVSVFYTSPTAIRMLMQQGDTWLDGRDLNSLRVLGSVGEPINPEAWHWFYRTVGKERCPIVDTWWQTETGSFMIAPTPGIEMVPMTPGVAGHPLPGIDAAVVDEEGNDVPAGEKGTLVIRKPWPGLMLTVHNDDERYERQYWSKYAGCFNADDYAIRLEDGRIQVLGRADEVLKVAGHRLGSSEIESAAVSHRAVAEAAAVGVADPVRGEALVLFTVLMTGETASDELRQSIVDHLRAEMGAIVTPKAVYLVQSLPKTRSGKIMRRVLRAVASDEPTGDVSTLDNEASVDEVKAAYAALQHELKPEA